MKITLTQNKFNPNPYYDQRIKAELTDNFVKNLPNTMDTFDQNGFDLTNLERLYAKKMDYKIYEKEKEFFIKYLPSKKKIFKGQDKKDYSNNPFSILNQLNIK